MSIRLWLLFCFCSFIPHAQGLTRNPTGSERSLLYWRYLCENSPQTETRAKHSRELSCDSQNWLVKTHFDEKAGVEKVSEVIEK